MLPRNIKTFSHQEKYWIVTYTMGYNSGKVMGNNTAVYQVIYLLSYYLYCLMLDILGKHISNKKLTIKSFLEGAN